MCVRRRSLVLPSNNLPNRQSVHLPWYDYCQPGAYFVTICVGGRRQLFGNIADGKMYLNQVGLIAQAEWKKLLERFLGLSLDEYVFMPNHLHGILILKETVKRRTRLPDVTRVPERFHASMIAQTIQQQQQQEPISLWEVIRTFKAATACLVRKAGCSQFGWQRREYVSILTTQKALTTVQEYIQNNPTHREKDALYQ